jgi:hypothetical protein
MMIIMVSLLVQTKKFWVCGLSYLKRGYSPKWSYFGASGSPQSRIFLWAGKSNTLHSDLISSQAGSAGTSACTSTVSPSFAVTSFGPRSFTWREDVSVVLLVPPTFGLSALWRQTAWSDSRDQWPGPAAFRARTLGTASQHLNFMVSGPFWASSGLAIVECENNRTFGPRRGW